MQHAARYAARTGLAQAILLVGLLNGCVREIDANVRVDVRHTEGQAGDLLDYIATGSANALLADIENVLPDGQPVILLRPWSFTQAGEAGSALAEAFRRELLKVLQYESRKRFRFVEEEPASHELRAGLGEGWSVEPGQSSGDGKVGFTLVEVATGSVVFEETYTEEQVKKRSLPPGIDDGTSTQTGTDRNS